MSLVVPLILGLLGTRVGALLADRAGLPGARAWSSWSASAGVAVAAVLAAAAVTHAKEPQRSRLVAIVPAWVPLPERVVTASGVAEVVLAAGLVHPRTRRSAAVGAIALLLAVYPANVVAARGVAHPAAPDTALLPRTLLQLVLVGACVVAADARRPHRSR